MSNIHYEFFDYINNIMSYLITMPYLITISTWDTFNITFHRRENYFFVTDCMNYTVRCYKRVVENVTSYYLTNKVDNNDAI